tara:strand:+ start:2698 stop:2850 length:153 start_codon:yes stop_codon:yes gene_type:complete
MINLAYILNFSLLAFAVFLWFSENTIFALEGYGYEFYASSWLFQEGNFGF